MRIQIYIVITLLSILSLAAGSATNNIVTKYKSTALLISASKPGAPADQVQKILNQSGQLVRFVSMQPGPSNGRMEVNQYRDDWVRSNAGGPIVRRTIGMMQRVYDPNVQGSMSIDLNSRAGRKFRTGLDPIIEKVVPEIINFQDRQAQAEYQRYEFQQHFQDSIRKKEQYIDDLRQQSRAYEQRRQEQDNIGMTELGANLVAALDESSALTVEERQARDEASALSNNPLRSAEYEYNASAAKQLESDLQTAATEKRFQEMTELSEALTYGKVDGKIRKSKVLETYARPDGVLKVGGTFDQAKFQTDVYSSNGQAVRRLANRYQALWAQSNGLSVLSSTERARYTLGAMAVSLADRELAIDGVEQESVHRGAGLLSFAQTMADSLVGFGVGVSESVKSLVQSVPELAVLTAHGVHNLFTDPAAAWDMTCDFIMNLPEMGGMMIAMLAKDYDQVKNGNAYERGEVLGRYALDIVSMLATAGAGAAAKGASVSAKVGEFGAVLAKSVPVEFRTRAAMAMKSSMQILEKMPKPMREGLLKAATRDVNSVAALSEAYVSAARKGQTATVQYLEKVAAAGVNIDKAKDISKVAKLHARAMKALDSIPGVARETMVSRAIAKTIIEDGVKKTLTVEDVFKKHWRQLTSEHRYTIGGPMGTSGLYLVEGSVAQATSTLLEETGKGISELIIAEKRIKFERLLDLTQEETLKKLGVTKSMIELPDNYKWTQMIGDAAKQKGYEGIIFKSTKGFLDNIVIFN